MSVDRVLPKLVRSRFGALRTLPPFMALIWRTSPGLTAATLPLRLVRAVLPVVTLFVGKLIIDEVVRLAGLPNAPGPLRDWIASGLLLRLGLLLGGASWVWRSRPTRSDAECRCWICCCPTGSATRQASG